MVPFKVSPGNAEDFWETQTTQDRLTLLRLHLCDFLEPVPPHLTVTWLMGLAKALPADREGVTREMSAVKTQSTESKPA